MIKYDPTVDVEFVGHIPHYVLRQQTFEETIAELTKTKEEYEAKGYFNFSMWFECGEDSNCIMLRCERKKQ